MLVVRERGLRTIPKTKVDAIAWWVDSSATTHVCKDRCWFKTFEPVEDGFVLYMGDEHFALVHGKRSVALEFSSGKTVTLFNVMYVPKLRFGYYNNGMFMLNLNKVLDYSDSVYMVSSSTVVSSSLWHARLGHVHYKRMLEMSKDDLIPAIDETPKKCIACMAVVRLPDPKQKTLGEKGIDCIFVGYAKHSKAYSDDVPSEIPEPRKEVIDDEIVSIMENNTWVLSDLPPGCKPLGYKWIFKRKMKVDGTIDKFKARLVIQGFRQKEGIDYFNTNEPVARITTIRLLLALAAIHNLVIHQMDVKTTFLNGDLDEEVYMKQPEGFVMPGNKHKVYKLVKSLYGLKQAPKQWHQKVNEVVLSSGFHLNQSENCVYSKFDSSGKGVIICLYVDNMLIFGTDQNQVDETKKFLSSRFSMKDIGEVNVFLGIKIKRENKGIFITQSHYIEKRLKKFNREDCSSVNTLMDPVEKLMPNTGKHVDHLEYSRAIGCLMFTSNPSRQHWKAITRVFKYLRGTKDYGLSYVGYPLVLEGYSDASWINHVEDSSSTSGWVFLLGGGAISWASKKQTCITSSTMESEFVALAAAGKEAEWLRNLIHEIPIWPKPIAPISIRCDSAPTMARAYSQIYNGKSRHLGVRHSMVRELIRNGVISIEFVRTQHNLADHLTKGLARDLVEDAGQGFGKKPAKITIKFKDKAASYAFGKASDYAFGKAEAMPLEKPNAMPSPNPEAMPSPKGKAMNSQKAD
ncbi:zinc finger, CCHC-type containing protein [Tanacetum coccineum]